MEYINTKCLKFIGSKVQELIQHGISVYISNKPNLNKKYGGSFSSQDKIIKIAMGSGVYSMYKFVHEYAHFLQYKDKPEFWENNFISGMSYYLGWLETGESKGLNIKKLFNKTLIIEHDAEQMALSIISSHNLGLDMNICIKEANANLLFYVWTRMQKKWCSGCFLGWDQSMYDRIPRNLLTLLELTDKKCMKKIFKKMGLE